MVLDPIPQSLPVHFFGSRPQPPTSHLYINISTASSNLTHQHPSLYYPPRVFTLKLILHMMHYELFSLHMNYTDACVIYGTNPITYLESYITSHITHDVLRTLLITKELH